MDPPFYFFPGPSGEMLSRTHYRAADREEMFRGKAIFWTGGKSPHLKKNPDPRREKGRFGIIFEEV
jgi:hypothetical protein